MQKFTSRGVAFEGVSALDMLEGLHPIGNDGGQVRQVTGTLDHIDSLSHAPKARTAQTSRESSECVNAAVDHAIIQDIYVRHILHDRHILASETI
jgi:hypothetical protein